MTDKTVQTKTLNHKALIQLLAKVAVDELESSVFATLPLDTSLSDNDKENDNETH